MNSRQNSKDWKNDFRRWKLKHSRLIIGLVTLSITFLLQACEQESRLLSLDLEVAELVCSDGQKIFEGRILELKGIKSVTANIDSQKAQLRYRENLVSPEQIIYHLNEAGFTINGTSGNPIAQGRLPECCFQQRENGE